MPDKWGCPSYASPVISLLPALLLLFSDFLPPPVLFLLSTCDRDLGVVELEGSAGHSSPTVEISQLATRRPGSNAPPLSRPGPCLVEACGVSELGPRITPQGPPIPFPTTSASPAPPHPRSSASCCPTKVPLGRRWPPGQRRPS